MEKPTSRLLLIALLVLVATPVTLFLATGLFDYLYIRYIVAQFDKGLAEVDLANPSLMKALVAGVGALVSWHCLRSHAISMGWVRNIVSYLTTTAFSLMALVNLISGLATWGHYFNGLGHSLLRYEITYDNRVLFYANHTISPYTARMLVEVTPDVVYELEARRRGRFREVLDPRPEDWFAPGDGSPMLWYGERDDGIHVFNMPGFDPTSRGRLDPVTPEVQQRYYREKQRQRSLEQARQQERTRARQIQTSLATGAALPGERFPQTRLRLLSEQDAARWTAADFRYAINEMFARRGAEFPGEEMQAVFRGFSWYSPRAGVSFDAIEESFSPVEKQNLQLLARLRDRRVSAVAQATPPPSRAIEQPKPRGGTSWHINLLPDINISLNGRPLNLPSRQPPYHALCRTNHYPGDICPATGRRNTP